MIFIYHHHRIGRVIKKLSLPHISSSSVAYYEEKNHHPIILHLRYEKYNQG